MPNDPNLLEINRVKINGSTCCTQAPSVRSEGTGMLAKLSARLTGGEAVATNNV